MAQMLSATPISKGVEPGKESYQIDWTIPRWLDVRKPVSLGDNQESMFETGSPSAWFRTKWIVGLKPNPSRYYIKKVRVYWKLVDIKGPHYSTKLEATLQTKLLSGDVKDPPKFTDEETLEVMLLDTVENSTECLDFNPESSTADRDPVSVTGSIRFKLRVTLTTPTMNALAHDFYIMEQFSKKSVERLRQNQALLLNDHGETSDVKFVTSDQVEIPAHKAILKAQCPVFAAMLNCDLSENATGIIKMTDISGKTMNILLHYFYTGDLLPSWRDSDTIVEFTYAAGKYQMTEVLKMLDEMLGGHSWADASNLDVQLINLAGKLKLEKAEGKLLIRIVGKVKKLGMSGELFELFGYGDEEVEEMVQMLANEKVGDSVILGMIDELYEGSISSKVIFEMGMIVLTLVEKKGLKKLEKNLLKSFSETADLLENSEELFDLFGRGKRMRE